MNLFLILIPQSLNSQFLNLAPYSHYDEDGVQKSDLVLRSNNEVWSYDKVSQDIVFIPPFLVLSRFFPWPFLSPHGSYLPAPWSPASPLSVFPGDF